MQISYFNINSPFSSVINYFTTTYHRPGTKDDKESDKKLSAHKALIVYLEGQII